MIPFFAVVCMAGISVASGAETTGTEARHPNIVLILTDDMGYGEVTSYGENAGVATPNIDRLAKEGARFTQYYAPAPVCSPSRAGLLTGQFPGRHRLNSFLNTRQGNRDMDQNDFLDPSAPTLPRALKRAGYATAHIGKWHLGGGRDVDNAPSIGKYGYDEWVSTWESPEPHPDLGVKFASWDKKKEPGQVERHKRTAYMVDRTLDFMKRHKEQPCFVNLWPEDMHAPHWPGPGMARKHGAPKGDRKTSPKAYAAVLEEYDIQIGRLLDGLREMGVEKDTIVIFTSDNGPGPPVEPKRTAGLRGMKLSLYEGGIRQPFLVRWPDHIPAGHLDRSTVLTGVDLPLTLCRMAGVEPPAGIASQSDGEDLSAALLGKPSGRSKPIFWEYGRRPAHGRPRVSANRSPNVAVRDGEWKLLINDDGTSVELYNVLANPRETKNVAERFPSITDDLSSRALAWRKELPGRSHSGGN